MMISEPTPSSGPPARAGVRGFDLRQPLFRIVAADGGFHRLAVEGADFFGQRGEQFAHNVRNYYDYCRDRDLFLTHAIVNPQSDRSKGSHQQDNAFVHLGVVDETPDGLIVRGAKMLATHGPTADELLVYPQPGIR